MSNRVISPAPARHPFRAHLIRPPRAPVANPDDSDLKLFALSFTAFFVCFYTLIF
jgi:hypothetical protein